MIQNYPLEWLDSLITLTLNPKKMYFQDITKEDAQALSEKAIIETLHIQSELKNKVFSLTKESQVKLLVRKYHSALIILLDSVIDHQKNELFKKSELVNITKTLTSCLDEILSFIETRFANFLSLEERVPPTYLEVSKTELRMKLDRIRKRLVTEVADVRFTDIVLGNLYNFINSKKDPPTSFRELLYRKELVKELELLGKAKNKTSIYTALNELLIYMNFNSRSYINYFTRRIAEKINLLENKAERVDSLHFHFKEFKQMHCNQNTVLYPHHQNLKISLTNWFNNEIAYLEKTMPLSGNPKEERKAENTELQFKEKVLCDLSSDQVGIILRAADELRILKAKSMSEVFKNIIPYLATARKQILSYNAVRINSYKAEEKDKQVAIEALEKIIQKIKGY